MSFVFAYLMLRGLPGELDTALLREGPTKILISLI